MATRRKKGMKQASIMSRFFQILLLGWLLYGDNAQAVSTFAIYDDDRNGEGAWKEGIIAFE